jgi:hypothetical protein
MMSHNNPQDELKKTEGSIFSLSNESQLSKELCYFSAY